MKFNKLYRIKFYIFFAVAAFVFPLRPAFCRQLNIHPLRNFEIPKVQRVTLDNGMQLFLAQDDELPVIQMQVMIQTGSIYDPPPKLGLAAMTGMVMRTGGTAGKTGDKIDEELESIAAKIETGIEINSGYASLWSLKENFDAALPIFADILMNPAFGKDKIELAKIQLSAQIARRNDDVYSLTLREYNKLIYGADSVYARQTEYSTISNISRDDLVAFHKKYFYPNNMMLAVCGDFNSNEMIKKLAKTFQNWKKAEVNLPQIPKLQYEFRPTVNLICKNDLNQSSIFLGHIGGQLNDRDYFALAIINKVLGAGFTGRLFKNVRSRQGLAYAVFGGFRAEFDYPGVFYVGCQTKSSATVAAINAMMDEIKYITQKEISDEELAIAKENYLNSFVFNFESKYQVVKRLMTFAYFGYPADFLQKTKENIEKVTKEDILKVARENLKPDKMQILVVGRPQDFGKSLSSLGPVSEIDINIPAPK